MIRKDLFSVLVILSVILLLVLGVSCESKTKKHKSFKGVDCTVLEQKNKEIDVFKDSTVMIDLNKFKGQELVFTDIIDSVSLIPLETKEDVLIGQIDKVNYYNESYYILDKRISKTLFVFDKVGQFKYSIEAKGKGPLEFINPYDFTIDYDLNLIIVFDGKLSKLIYYNAENGLPIKEKRIAYRFHNIAYSGSGNFWISSHDDDNSHMESINNYMLFRIDSNCVIKDKFLYDDHMSKNNYFMRNDLSQNFGTNYAPRFKNKIYEIKDSILHEKYVLQYDNIEIDSESYNMSFSDFKNVAERKSKFYFMGKYLGGETVDYFELESTRRKIRIFHNKENNELVGGEFLVFDSYKLPFYSDPVASCNDEFISYLMPLALTGIKNSVELKELKKLAKSHYSLIQNISSEANPVIIRYKINLDLLKKK